GPSTLQRIAPVRLDLPIRGHGGGGSRLGLFCNFYSDRPIALGGGGGLSPNSRAPAGGVRPILAPPRHSTQPPRPFAVGPPPRGTVNSSLTLRPSAGGCAKRRW